MPGDGFGIPPDRLDDKGRPSVIPREQPLCVVKAEARPPSLYKPCRVRLRFPFLVSRFPQQVPQSPVYITCAPLTDSLSGKLNGRRDGRMRRYTGQPAQLIGAEAQHIVEAGIGAIELQGTVELPLAPEYARRELVGEPAVAFGETLQVAVSSIGEWRAGAYVAENLQSRPASGGCFLNPASPAWGKTASRLRGAASGPRARRRGPRWSPGAWPAPSPPDPAPRRSPCSSGSRPRLAPSSRTRRTRCLRPRPR